MTLGLYLGFLAACAVLVATPGQDTLLALRFGAIRFSRGVVFAAAVTLGVIVWTVLALTGLAAFLQTSPLLFLVIKLIGGGYLCYLGARLAIPAARRLIRMRRDARGARPADHDHLAYDAVEAERVVTLAEEIEGTDGAPGGTAAAAGGVATAVRPEIMRKRVVFRTGIISCLTNPKTGLFYLALLPAFVPANPTIGDLVLLGASAAAMMFVYLAVAAFFAGTLRTFIEGPKRAAIMDTVFGSLFCCIGITLMLT